MSLITNAFFYNMVYLYICLCTADMLKNLLQLYMQSHNLILG